MWDHTEELHRCIMGNKPNDDYIFELHRQHRDSLTRQMTEIALLQEIKEKGRINHFKQNRNKNSEGILQGKCSIINRRDET